MSAQCDLLELLIALAPSLTLEHVSLLWRAVKPLLTHAQPPLQKKAYKTVCALAEHHASFVRERLPEWREAMEAALADTHSTCRRARRNQRAPWAHAATCAPDSPRARCRHKRLRCVGALVAHLPQSELTPLLPSLLGERTCSERREATMARAYSGLATQARLYWPRKNRA